MFTVSYTKDQVVTLLFSLMQCFPTTVLQNIFIGSTRNNGHMHIKIFEYHKELQITKLQKATTASSCQSVCLHGTTWLPPDRFPWNL